MRREETQSQAPEEGRAQGSWGNGGSESLGPRMCPRRQGSEQRAQVRGREERGPIGRGLPLSPIRTLSSAKAASHSLPAHMPWPHPEPKAMAETWSLAGGRGPAALRTTQSSLLQWVFILHLNKIK